MIVINMSISSEACNELDVCDFWVLIDVKLRGQGRRRGRGGARPGVRPMSNGVKFVARVATVPA